MPGCRLAVDPVLGAAILQQLHGLGALSSVLDVAVSFRCVAASRLIQIHPPRGRK